MKEEHIKLLESVEISIERGDPTPCRQARAMLSLILEQAEEIANLKMTTTRLAGCAANGLDRIKKLEEELGRAMA